MFEKTYRLLVLLDKLGEIRGRKKLQKTVFLLQDKGCELMSRFEYHHYGPYSTDLQAEMADMVTQGLIGEGQENGTYLYRLTEKGRSFKAKWEAHFSSENIFHLEADLVQLLNRQSPPFLELVSTYAYLLETGCSEEQAYQKAQLLKPHLAEKLPAAVDFYQRFRAL